MKTLRELVEFEERRKFLLQAMPNYFNQLTLITHCKETPNNFTIINKNSIKTSDRNVLYDIVCVGEFDNVVDLEDYGEILICNNTVVNVNATSINTILEIAIIIASRFNHHYSGKLGYIADIKNEKTIALLDLI